MNKNFLELIKNIKKKFKQKKIYLHEPHILKDDITSVLAALKSKEISSYGKYTSVFEKKLGKYLGEKKTLSLVNGTAALHIAYKVMGINHNHEVLAPSMTYISTINAIKYCNSEPHFYEIEQSTLSVDLKKLEAYLKKKTIIKNKKCINKKTQKHIKAFVLVHINGLCCEIDKLLVLLNRYKIVLIEDAAEAIGSSYKNKKLGTFGEVGILSFNGNKIISTGGGGAIIFKKQIHYKKALHYISNCKKKHPFEFAHDDVGYNYRMPSLNAALGISQLKKLQHFVNKKKLIYLYYKSIFKNNQYKLLEPINKLSSNYWLPTITATNKKINLTRLIKSAHTQNFFLRSLWKPMHLLLPFKHCQKMSLRNTVRIYKSTVCLPGSVFLLK